MGIQIEKGIPIPNRKRSGLASALREMQVGDLFLIAKDKRQSIYTTAKQVGVKVMVRVTESGQLRAWRTA